MGLKSTYVRYFGRKKYDGFGIFKKDFQVISGVVAGDPTPTISGFVNLGVASAGTHSTEAPQNIQVDSSDKNYYVGKFTGKINIDPIITLTDLTIGYVSNISEPITIVRTSGEIEKISKSSTSVALQVGDVIMTENSKAIVTFLDNSTLRLDTSTTVQLLPRWTAPSPQDGATIAEEILSDGRLWGRILTSTGVNLGGGGLVIGVRG